MSRKKSYAFTLPNITRLLPIVSLRETSDRISVLQLRRSPVNICPKTFLREDITDQAAKCNSEIYGEWPRQTKGYGHTSQDQKIQDVRRLRVFDEGKKGNRETTLKAKSLPRNDFCRIAG